MRLKAILVSCMLLMSCVMTACSGAEDTSSAVDANTSTTTTTTSVATEATSETTTTTQTTEATTTQKADEAPDVTTPSENEEDTAVEEAVEPDIDNFTNVGEISAVDAVTIATVGYDASTNRKWADIAKYTNLDFLFYAHTGEKLTENELVDILKKGDWYGEEISEDSSFASVGELENLAFPSAIKASEEEVKAINDFIKLLEEDADTEMFPNGIDYKITDAWKVRCEYDGSEEEFANSGTYPHMYVIEVDGVWKLDTSITILMELYNAFSDLETGLETESGFGVSQ